MGDKGLEPVAQTTGKTSDSKVSGAESGAVAAEISPNDSELRQIIETWPRLSEALKASILAMVRAADLATED